MVDYALVVSPIAGKSRIWRSSFEPVCKGLLDRLALQGIRTESRDVVQSAINSNTTYGSKVVIQSAGM